jgi:hypothetical protein
MLTIIGCRLDSTNNSTNTSTSTESSSDAWSTVACSEESLGPGPWIRKLPPRVQPFTSGQFNICPTAPNQQQCKILILLVSCEMPACDDLDDGLLQKAPIRVVSPRLPLASLPQRLPCRRADEDGTGHIMALSGERPAKSHETGTARASAWTSFTTSHLTGGSGGVLNFQQ